jgi:dGTPase
MENTMHWEKLLSSKRFGNESFQDNRLHDRSEFQRDYDRLIFSAPFRRLQNKTQVFPLPGSVFVHNRLTHSLEVASVGRSLGLAVSKALRSKHGWMVSETLTELGDIVSAACLAHDLGNPPFGHSGEKAIASYFLENESKPWLKELTDTQYADFCRFEGNANAFRLLTHQFTAHRPGGFVLTYSTLASIVKYPYASLLADSKHSKFGFFTSESDDFARVANELGMLRDPSQPLRYARHPLVYLVEAADDICYLIMDLEDAHKLKLVSSKETIDLLLGFFEGDSLIRRKETLLLVEDVNEQIAYLRSSVIGRLIKACSTVFVENEKRILAGMFQGSLIKQVDHLAKSAYSDITKLSIDRIYRSSDVLDVELAGYKIITTLLEELIAAVIHPDRAYSKVLIERIPNQYGVRTEKLYSRIQAVLDYVSSMTDVYALDLFQKMNGSSLPVV